MLSQRTLPALPPPFPLLIRSPCPAVPFPAPAICIYSEEAAAAASEKKNENFFHLFEGFPATRTHPLAPALLFLYMYIYFCRVEEEKIFFCETHTATGELDALLGSARETEKELRQRQERGSIWGWGERWDCV